MPTLVVFDLSHVANYRRLVEEGGARTPYVFPFVFDLPFALPYSGRYLDLFLEHLPPSAIWFCVRHH